MTLSAQDVRDVRFGTTRIRAGYDMKEVDAFLDTVESAIAQYASDSQLARDDASALRSQVAQLQARLAAVQSELEQCQEASRASTIVPAEHDTIVTELPSTPDVETTAETPVVGGGAEPTRDRLVRVRDEVRAMLVQQLEIVDRLEVDRFEVNRGVDE